MKDVICQYCKKKIEKRDQLVTGSKFLKVRPFHYVCFQEMEQEVKVPWGFWTPQNGLAGNIRAISMLVLAIWMFATDTLELIGDVAGVLAIYSMIPRVLSYFLYEQKVPK